MKYLQPLILAAFALTLAACNDNEKQTANTGSVNDIAPKNAQSTTDHGVKDKSEVGFEMAGGKIEEATNIPENEKTAILAAFDEYMEAFNEEDLNRYMNTISKNPEGFSYETERTDVQDVFTEYDINRTAKNITIIKYDENNAQLFAELHTEMEQTSTGIELKRDGRQVTVFVKENGKWLVTSVYFIANSSQ